MVEKKVLVLVMFVITYCLAITNKSEGQMSPTCDEYNPLFIPCVPYLVNPDFSTPTARCCVGASQQLTKGNNPAVLKKLCTCLDASTANLGFFPQKLIQLPTMCKIKLSFSIEKCVNG
ncbi:hypothetical protein V8G54_031751 [Vigna mungo]|uniref:Bifunctional inhibitor/plant lipid transfer protein/seed storage helical domain-containing protein n=1 Tax=Vigna mungo TaxID=3915 RepID=A0AAQ3ML07_VIGMU